jgi:hypothetical protein
VTAQGVDLRDRPCEAARRAQAKPLGVVYLPAVAGFRPFVDREILRPRIAR